MKSAILTLTLVAVISSCGEFESRDTHEIGLTNLSKVDDVYYTDDGWLCDGIEYSYSGNENTRSESCMVYTVAVGKSGQNGGLQSDGVTIKALSRYLSIDAPGYGSKFGHSVQLVLKIDGAIRDTLYADNEFTYIGIPINGTPVEVGGTVVPSYYSFYGSGPHVVEVIGKHQYDSMFYDKTFVVNTRRIHTF